MSRVYTRCMVGPCPHDVKCVLAEPGGRLLVRDGDLITYNREHPPPPEGHEPNIAASLQGRSNAAVINRIFAGEALKRGFVVGYAFLFLKPRTENSSSYPVADFPTICQGCSRKPPLSFYPPVAYPRPSEAAATCTKAGMGHPCRITRISAS